ncbi:MAG TPA: glycosyltransferase [Candidatus Paceibacterota bacterium]|nr:glycosyltransferase [Candidatus Paceibacterota bacterium]
MTRPQPRVLLLINSFAVGGAERVFIKDSNALHDSGWNVSVATLFKPGTLASELTIDPAHVINLGFASVWNIHGIVRLVHLLRREKIDVLYTTLNEANLIGRIARLFMPHLRLYTREANMADIKSPIYKFGDIVLGWLSTRIVAVSHAVEDSVAKYAPWLRGRIVVLHNGVEIPPLVKRPPHYEMKLLTVGSLTEKKDHEILLRACALLPASYKLTIVGDGTLRKFLAELSQELGLAERVVFTGALPFDKVAQHYRTHDIFVLPSKYEGCPNVISEAQSFSLPSVAFDIAGMREFITDQSGVIVVHRDAHALAEALSRLGGSQELRLSMGNAGREEVQERSLEHHISQLERLLHRII